MAPKFGGKPSSPAGGPASRRRRRRSRVKIKSMPPPDSGFLAEAAETAQKQVRNAQATEESKDAAPPKPWAYRACQKPKFLTKNSTEREFFARKFGFNPQSSAGAPASPAMEPPLPDQDQRHAVLQAAISREDRLKDGTRVQTNGLVCVKEGRLQRNRS